MKRGDKLNCPACHHETVVKEKVEMDGWTVGEKYSSARFARRNSAI